MRPLIFFTCFVVRDGVKSCRGVEKRDEIRTFWTKGLVLQALFHDLCKHGKWHKIQNGNRAGKSRSGLSARNCILAEIAGHVQGGCLRQPFILPLTGTGISATAAVCPQRKFPVANEFRPNHGVCRSIFG